MTYYGGILGIRVLLCMILSYLYTIEVAYIRKLMWTRKLKYQNILSIYAIRLRVQLGKITRQAWEHKQIPELVLAILIESANEKCRFNMIKWHICYMYDPKERL